MDKDKDFYLIVVHQHQNPYFCDTNVFMDLLKISAVSYLNTYPFVFGLRESGLMQNMQLELDVPAICAQKLKNGTVNVALVPVGALPEIGKYHYISDYCIGAVGEVKTVLLLSKVPIDQISHIYLDYDSRTSVELVRVLAKYHWQIDPVWEHLKPGQSESMTGAESMVAIGDKTFNLRSGFPYVYDLAEAWITFSGLPFVFAVWISKEEIPENLLAPFRAALSYGISHKRECLDYFRDKLPAGHDCMSYLEHNISYDFDERKKNGLKLFLSYITGN